MPETAFKPRGFILNYVSRTKNGRVVGKKPKQTIAPKIIEISKKVDIKVDSDADPVCIICYDTENEEEKEITLGCRHTFHQACIDDWFAEQRNCPTCRATFHNGNYDDFVPEQVVDYGDEDY